MEKIRYIDLCCGIGGFRVGINAFDPQRFECVFSADIKKDAIITYNANFSEDMPERNIFDITELPPFDLLCAGFPCQPFSAAGHKLGFKDSRGGMIFKILELCKKYRPTSVLLENVANLLTLDKGECISKIRKLFSDIGYHVTYKKLNAVDFGVPQSRERVYIICSLVKEISFDPIQTLPAKKLADILETTENYTDIDLSLKDKLLEIHRTQKSIYGCKLADKRGGEKNIHSWDIGYNGVLSGQQKELMGMIMLERRKKHWAEKKQIPWMDGMPLTLEDIKTFCAFPDLPKMLENLTSLNYLRLEQCKGVVDGKRAYKADSEYGYNICKGKLSFPISKILDPEDVAPTLTATDCSKLVFLVNNENIRRATDNELKRMCGFPDSFIIPPNVSNKYDLFGNMVVPTVVTAILGLIYL